MRQIKARAVARTRELRVVLLYHTTFYKLTLRKKEKKRKVVRHLLIDTGTNANTINS